MKCYTTLFFRAGVILPALLGSAQVTFGQTATGSEKPKQLPAAIVRKYDVDKDGVLNEEEKAAWRADVQRGRQEAQARRLEKYDANRDGKLDKAEKAAAASDVVKKPGKAASKKASPADPDAPSDSELPQSAVGTRK